jgi:hypothetical protein
MRLRNFILVLLGAISGFLLARNMLSKRAKSHNAISPGQEAPELTVAGSVRICHPAA